MPRQQSIRSNLFATEPFGDWSFFILAWARAAVANQLLQLSNVSAAP